MTASQLETIVLGGGCFWCTEAVFDRVQGVVDVESGYSNGDAKNPSYEQVCTGRTGHNEVVKLAFDPAQISLREILEIFFVVHDATTLNRQGNDSGTQYRSIILYTSEAQKAAAEKSKAVAQKHFKAPIVTQILPLTKFYKAEGYHQDYYRSNMDQPYCRAVIRPKVEKFEKKLQSPKS